ncbi:MAG: hypothetical protein EOP81_15360 [Variovorax sp.]|nr:MAG: hypothetical protein EOP81_15360 [Variovorax sp.]
MTPSQHPTSQLLLLGVGQAIGFVVGALLGRWLGLLLGFDALAEGYTNQVMVGIVLIAIGGGGGVQLARALYKRKYGDPRV